MTAPTSVVGDLLGDWVHGWAISRAVPRPAEVPGGWRLEVGAKGHRVRYVVTADDDAVGELGHREAAPGVWIKVAAEPEYLRRMLPAGWTTGDTGHLMTADLVAGPVTVSASYATRTTFDGDLVVVTITDTVGRTAASGRLGVAGSSAVFDQIVTAPEHRRRGLGRAVMDALGHEAVRRGVRRGVLVATDEGRDLYRALGWMHRTPLAAAYVPES